MFTGHENGATPNSDLLKRVPWAEFDRLVAAHEASADEEPVIALLYGQLSGAANLREIVGGLESHAVQL